MSRKAALIMSRLLLAALFLTACAAGARADWKPARGPLMTRWARDVSADKVLPEYPRPLLVRPGQDRGQD
jgi:hypothetical protein